MTAVASDIDVCTIYFKIGLHVVIEQPQVPGDRVVARAAVGVKHAIVGIVFQVTADALGISVGEYLALVTIRAFNIVVLTEQWKAAKVVIEERCGQPFTFVVAISALLPQCSVMRIVLEMT